MLERPAGERDHQWQQRLPELGQLVLDARRSRSPRRASSRTTGVGEGVHLGSAESIDVKEGTQKGVICGNTFNGKGIAGQHSADSWVDVKGSGYLLENNTGTLSKPGTPGQRLRDAPDRRQPERVRQHLAQQQVRCGRLR
ncbi:hypothetical protein ACSHWB_41765 [Lentzea sp. HUAS TT2]|uniref:hypothetical protein n=1 Tax=Lentzea sp. HUAS TT2 TaxID=3447454 RepID=UPI003F70DFC7